MDMIVSYIIEGRISFIWEQLLNYSSFSIEIVLVKQNFTSQNFWNKLFILMNIIKVIIKLLVLNNKTFVNWYLFYTNSLDPLLFYTNFTKLSFTLNWLTLMDIGFFVQMKSYIFANLNLHIFCWYKLANFICQPTIFYVLG